VERCRPGPALLFALVGAALLGVPSVAGAATIEVTSGALRVDVPPPATNTGHSGATAMPLSGGGAIVGLFGNINSATVTVGPGCAQVATSNVTAPAGSGVSGAPEFAATCDLTGAVGVVGTLLATDRSQAWYSTLAIRTKVSAHQVGGQGVSPSTVGVMITTGPAGDTIDGGAGPDVIDAGGAPYKGQEAFPGTTGQFEDPHVNFINAGAGNDTIHLERGTGRDTVSGGTGVDGVTYAGRFSIGFPGQTGVNVSLNDLADDGDPNIDQPDSTDAGEGDNVRSDVENVTGTKREDVLTGSSSGNVLEGGEGKDKLTGLAGVDALRAREPSSAGIGIRDTLSCGTPPPPFPPQTFMGASIGSTSPGDSLNFDLADVPPGDCEVLDQGPVKEGPNVVVAASARRAGGGRLRVGLRCPRTAGRTCAGTLRLAARRGRSGPTAGFSIRRGRARAVTVALPAGSALGRRRTTVRLVAVERGRHGRVTTAAYARVPA
jgi:hypothetical protein